MAARERSRRNDQEISKQTHGRGIVAPCKNKNLAIRVVDADTGRGVADLRVTIPRENDVPPTWQAEGVYVFDELADGVYIVRVVCCGLYGDDAIDVPATAGNGKQIEVSVRCLALGLALDADRDGHVDDPGTDFASWSAGHGSLGAIVLVNNLNHGEVFVGRSPPMPVVNLADETTTEAELPYLARLEIVPLRKGSAPLVARLRATPVGKLRIFHNSEVVLGPSKEEWIIPQPIAGRLLCFMEGLCYADATFDGRVTLTLSIEGESRPQIRRAVIRVAPWIMHNALDPLIVVYVVDLAIVKKMEKESYLAVEDYIADIEGGPRCGSRPSNRFLGIQP